MTAPSSSSMPERNFLMIVFSLHTVALEHSVTSPFLVYVREDIQSIQSYTSSGVKFESFLLPHQIRNFSIECCAVLLVLSAFPSARNLRRYCFKGFKFSIKIHSPLPNIVSSMKLYDNKLCSIRDKYKKDNSECRNKGCGRYSLLNTGLDTKIYRQEIHQKPGG